MQTTKVQKLKLKGIPKLRDADYRAMVLQRMADPAPKDGQQGDIGQQGDKGDQGPKGDRGDKGDIGQKGDRGDKGDQGDRGPKGDQGDRGDQGEIGLPGKDGENGKPGAPGDKGDQGPIPEHEIRESAGIKEIRFRQQGGKWGDWIPVSHITMTGGGSRWKDPDFGYPKIYHKVTKNIAIDSDCTQLFRKMEIMDGKELTIHDSGEAFVL